MDKLAFYKTFGMAMAGPIPMISGATPPTAKATYLATIGNPNF